MRNLSVEQTEKFTGNFEAGGGITATLSWLPWQGLELGQHGGVAVVVGGSIVGSGVGVIDGGVVFVALFAVNLFV
jgi:hypothetical protein